MSQKSFQKSPIEQNKDVKLYIFDPLGLMLLWAMQ